ncbi:unnamed protein product [Caenorhabditis angaria]|uniref:SP-RING-type domain-containing protein n=1 Tax=Caenorhabditis angaria TaxID=860376 RepID=A0A9P1I5W6_9PELO|nr:unnamed protein product [Caenorhabditis angaria]
MSFDHNTPALTPSQLRETEKFVNNLKVGELQKLLDKLHQSRRGLKTELLERVQSLLRSPSTQRGVYQYCQNEMSKHYSSVQHRSFSGVSFPQNNYRTGLSSGLGGSTMFSAQQCTMQPTNRAAPAELRIVALPFYDVTRTLLNPMELAAAQSSTQRYTTRAGFSFNLDMDNVAQIKYDSNNQKLPRYEVQLRFFNTSDLKDPQKDDFPLNVNVKLNGMMVNLPSVIPTNKPNTEAKRPSKPVDMTQQCQKRAGVQQLSIEWTCDKRSWAVGVYLVKRINTEILYNRLVEDISKHRQIEVTRQEITRRLNGSDDDGIAMDQLKIGLLCPLVKIRMSCPARCSDCTHLQCFDLTSYLMMNEKRAVWNCPVCSNYAPYEKLIIDEYFKDVINKVDSNTTEVELKADGRFEMLKNEESYDVSSDDDDGIQVKRETKHVDASSNSNSNPPSRPFSTDDVIVLSDSEDENDDMAAAISNSLRTPPPELETFGSNGNGNGNCGMKRKIDVITLDDTPPRLNEAKRRIDDVSSTTNNGFLPRTDLSRINLPPSTSQQPSTLVEALDNINGDQLTYHQDIVSPNNMHQNPMEFPYSNAGVSYANSWRQTMSTSSSASIPSMNTYNVPPPTPITPVNLIGRQMNDVMGNPMGGNQMAGPAAFNFNQPIPQHQQQPQQVQNGMMANNMPNYSDWGNYLNSLPFMSQTQSYQQPPPHHPNNSYRK